MTLQYDSDSHKYILLVPIVEPKTIKYYNSKIDCGIDLGVRCFAEVYSEKGVYEICTRKYDNSSKYDLDFKKYNRKIDIINEQLRLKEDYTIITYRDKGNLDIKS